MTGSLLDVCLALLLISGAAMTLVGVDRSDATDLASDRAGSVARTLATTTAPVEYTLGSGDPSSQSTESPEAERVAHATLAEHLARAAVRSATIDGEPLSPTTVDYRRAVRSTVADAVGSRTEIRAVWRPLPGVDIDGWIRVGSSPPATATVHAARFSVPVGPIDGPETNETAGSDGRVRTPAAPVEATVAVLFPPERIAAAARDDSPAVDAIVARYGRAGEALDVDATDALERDGPAAANRKLVEALSDRTAAARSTGEATADAPAPAPGRVTVVVRTWST